MGEVIVHGNSLISISDHLAKDTKAGNVGVVSSAHTTNIVLDGGDFTTAPSAVPVIRQSRLGQFSLVVKVVGALCVEVVLQIVAVHVEAIVDDGDGGVLAGNALEPDAGDVDIVALLNGVHEMPLFGEDGVGYSEGSHNGLLIGYQCSICRFVLARLEERPLRVWYYPLLPGVPEVLFLGQVHAIKYITVAKGPLSSPPFLQFDVDDVVIGLVSGENIVVF